METTEKPTLPKDIPSCIYRMERSYRNLLQFREQINCYTNEPKTYHWHKAKVILGDKMIIVLQAHLDTLELLRSKKPEYHHVFSLVQQQLTTARRLEQNVLEYIGRNAAAS